MENKSFLQIDRETIPAKYFAEDDCVRSIRNYPEYVGTMIICVDSFADQLAQGRLHTFYYEEHFLFSSLDQLLFAMEDVMDQAGTPQSWTEKKTFAKEKSKRKKDVPKEKAAQNITPFYDLKTMCPPKGRVASFYVRVYSRMHSSMQGVVMALDSSDKVAFRSELELLYLIREKLLLPKKAI